MVEATDKTDFDRVISDDEDDWNMGGRRSCGISRRSVSGGGDGKHLPADQIRRQLWEPVILALCPAVFDPQILSLDVAVLLQAPAKSRNEVSGFGG